MLEKFIKDYFSFTRKERLAVMVLVIVTVIIFLVPYVIPVKEEAFEKTAFDTLRLQLDNLKPANKKPVELYPERNHPVPGPVKAGNAPEKAELFYFDPNSLSLDGWKKLGLRERTIRTIQNYIAKGGKFKSKEDIGRIYGIHSNEVIRISPYVRIAPNKTSTYDLPARKSWSLSTELDINKADTAEWMALPGIGNKLALRIVVFREKLGGFYSIDQLAEVYGLPDSTFKKIRAILKINTVAAPFININTAQAIDLKDHPYIKWNIANAIVEFRKQHGNFKKLDDLRTIDIVTEEIYQKMVPYLKIE